MDAARLQLGDARWRDLVPRTFHCASGLHTHAFELLALARFGGVRIDFSDYKHKKEFFLTMSVLIKAVDRALACRVRLCSAG